MRLAGACVGCASSSATLRDGVENMLKHYIPEVKGILDVTGTLEADPDAEVDPSRTLAFKPETNV